MKEFKHWKDELPEPGRPLLYWIGYIQYGEVIDTAYTTGRFFEKYEDQPACFMDWQIIDKDGKNSLYRIESDDSIYLIDRDNIKYQIDLYWKYSEEFYGTNPYTGKVINERL